MRTRCLVWQLQQDIALQCVNLSAFDLRMGFRRNRQGQFSATDSPPTTAALVGQSSAIAEFVTSAIQGAKSLPGEIHKMFLESIEDAKKETDALGKEFQKAYESTNENINEALTKSDPKAGWKGRLANVIDTTVKAIAVIGDHPSFYGTLGMTVPLATFGLVLGVLEGRANEAYAAYREFYSRISDSFVEDLSAKAKINKVRDKIQFQVKKLNKSQDTDAPDNSLEEDEEMSEEEQEEEFRKLAEQMMRRFEQNGTIRDPTDPRTRSLEKTLV